MPISLKDYEKVESGHSKITGTCKYCEASVLDGVEFCEECATAPKEISVSRCYGEDGYDVFPSVPSSGVFTYVRADLVEKMKDE
ncbi:hypothetical protein FIV00_15190 [Labrenzia sp. THAF82]|uniref:hypothetical protein n=1 Tax=Labrenzia sp. THAF82 TaxID=2587861 RepID=UPI001268653A|nr:hypothetical protein [Labrenzia sp. THAF82]QFT31836.1 hypothetical protein FIV00_15190 [Labrenzia sp. THAF82]